MFHAHRTIAALFAFFVTASLANAATKSDSCSPLLKPRAVGLNVVVTGKFAGGSREVVERWLQSVGAQVSGSISKNTDVLIVGDAPGSNKLEAAKKLGVQIVTEADFNQNYLNASTTPSTSTTVMTAAVLPDQTVIRTIQDWNGLEEEDRHEYIDSGRLWGENSEKLAKQAKLKLIEAESLQKLSAKDLKAFASKMLAAAKSEIDVDFDESNPHAAKVGEPTFEFKILTLPDGTILGGMVNIYQAGAEDMDHEYRNFRTAKEAKAKGADPESDVSWHGYATFNHDMKLIKSSGYMEWSGY